ncbi:MAG: outer membrane beta-barrel protein, partial [Bacteroidetes bacterium]|nr:outer membrane beta-barrel protein [Bacteroidota bacterium]
FSQVKKNKELTVSFGPTSTKIKNKNISDDKYLIIDYKNGYNMDFCFNKYFSPRAGVGFGLGLSSFNQTEYQKGKFEKYSVKDIDGNIYDEWIDSDVTFTNKLKYLDLPITLHLLLGNSSRFYGFIDLGVINQFLLTGDYTMKGSVENMGTYPSGNPYFYLVSQNNSYYDYKVQQYDIKKTDTYKSYNLSGHFSFGLAAALNDNLFFKIQPYANIGFSDITAKDLQGVDYQNVFGSKSSYQKTKLFSLGLNVGFALNIGK